VGNAVDPRREFERRIKVVEIFVDLDENVLQNILYVRRSGVGFAPDVASELAFIARNKFTQEMYIRNTAVCELFICSKKYV
jgi:hypothetical protein